MKIFLKTVAAVMVLTTASMNLQAAISTDSSKDDRLQKQLPSTSEAFLEQVRVNSRLQAAEAAYNLSILAVNRKDLALAHSLIEESIQLNQSNPSYLTFAKEAIAIWGDSPVDPLRQAMGQNSPGRLFMSQRRFDDARLQFGQVLLLLKQNYEQDHPYIQHAIRNLSELDAVRDNVKKDRMYDELLREFSFRLPKQKDVTADNAPPLREQRIMHF